MGGNIKLFPRENVGFKSLKKFKIKIESLILLKILNKNKLKKEGFSLKLINYNILNKIKR